MCMPGLLASLAQMEKLYVPVSWPLVGQVYVGVNEYGCASSHVCVPGWRIQNSNRGCGQPEAVAVRVTVVPTDAELAGAAVALTEEHGAVPSAYCVDVYVSQLPRLFESLPELAESCAHTENEYVPGASPAVRQLSVGFEL